LSECGRGGARLRRLAVFREIAGQGDPVVMRLGHDLPNPSHGLFDPAVLTLHGATK